MFAPLWTRDSSVCCWNVHKKQRIKWLVDWPCFSSKHGRMAFLKGHHWLQLSEQVPLRVGSSSWSFKDSLGNSNVSNESIRCDCSFANRSRDVEKHPWHSIHNRLRITWETSNWDNYVWFKSSKENQLYYSIPNSIVEKKSTSGKSLHYLIF